MALMVACSPSVKVPEDTRSVEGPSLELSAIDSLMWRQPDSALAQLQAFCNSPVADSLDEFNGHYCQLLISELLYKNYAAQSNREELLQAVAYFDSLVCGAPHPPLKGGAQRAGDSKKISNLTPNLVFLDARAHYINGAGLYEQDDVVNACAEYLKALEVMEEHFEEKAQTGKKAVFMFYIYNRLLELFSAQFMMEPALTCGEKALAYCQNEPSLSKEIPNLYTHIGKQYEKKGEKENARNFYGLALEGLSDANSLVYRDAVSIKALSDYNAGLGADSSLTAIKQVLAQANTEKEKLTRFFSIGVIFTAERFFDSALYYLEPVFENVDNVSLKIQAAEYLIVSYNNLGNKEKSDECIRFLSNYKKTDGENKALVSKLEDLYKDYSNQKKEKEAEEAREKSIKKTIEIIVPIAILIALAVFIIAKWRIKMQHEEADRKLEDTEQEHEKELRLWQAEADKVLEKTKKKYEEELERLHSETEQKLEEVERKHQRRMAEAKERHKEELRVQRDLTEKEIEKTKKRHAEELEAERLTYQAEMAEKEAKAQTEHRLHEEALKRHQVETEKRMSEAERRHQQKLEEIAQKHELEMQAQHDKAMKEAEQTRKRHEVELEAERMAYQKKQEALRQNLRQREAQVNALETALGHQREEAARRREAFLKEPICQHINELLHGRHITARDTSFKHEAIALKEEDYKQLKEAVERHYAGFDNALLGRCPSLRHTDLALCHLHLMGLGEGEIAALRSRTYSGIKKQNESLQEKLGVKGSVAELVLRVAEGLVGPPDGVLSEVAWNETQRHSQKSSQKNSQKIVDLIKERPEITTAEMAERIGVSRRSIVNITNRLQEEGVIRRVGPDKGGHWEVVR